MPLEYIKTLELTVPAGGSAEDTWTPDADVHIKRMYVIGKGVSDLSNIELYIKVAEDVITRPQVLAELFKPSNQYVPEIDRDVPKGSKIYVKAENGGTSDVTIQVIFVVE